MIDIVASVQDSLFDVVERNSRGFIESFIAISQQETDALNLCLDLIYQQSNK